MIGDTLVTDTLREKLEPWLNNVPDYHDMTQTYEKLGKLKANEIALQRLIVKAEDNAIQGIDKIRSNDAKKAKILASEKLRDELAIIQRDLAIVEAEVKT
jgi:hypothetical protein